MTIEDYIASQLDGSVTPDRIEFIKFEGVDAIYCDTCGGEAFRTIFHFRVKSTEENYRKNGNRYVSHYGEIDRTIDLKEDDVVAFMKFMFPENVEQNEQR